MDACEERLDELLASSGFASYSDFMRVALVDEVTSRRAAAGLHRCAQHLRRGPGCRRSVPPSPQRDPPVHLDGELEQFGSYAHLNEELEQRSSALFGLADDGKVMASNAVIAAHRLGSDGTALATVAELKKQTFPVVAEQSRDTVASVERTRTQRPPRASAPRSR